MKIDRNRFELAAAKLTSIREQLLDLDLLMLNGVDAIDLANAETKVQGAYDRAFDSSQDAWQAVCKAQRAIETLLRLTAAGECERCKRHRDQLVEGICWDCSQDREAHRRTQVIR